MAVVIPQVVTEDRASGAQVIDGSLKFDRVSDSLNRGYLTRTFSDGNSKKWTWSAWIKRDNVASTNRIFGGNNGTATDADITTIFFDSASLLKFGGYNTFFRTSSASFRDSAGWYHLVAHVDIENSVSSLKYRAWVNGEEVVWGSSSDSTNTGLNRAGFTAYLGAEVYSGSASNGFGGKMSQCYFIDGQALGPEYFGYTDPLTNTWRPKKLTTWNNPNGDGVNWSNITSATGGFNVSYPKENLFEGVLTSANRAEASSNDDPIVIDFSSIGGVDVDSTLSIWSGKSSVRYQINDSGSYTSYSDAVEAWKDISFSGKLNNLKILHGSAGQAAGVSAIRIDGVILRDNISRWGQNGFYLPMDGNSPIGEDKSGITNVNNGTIWSANVSASTGSIIDAELAFNGSVTSGDAYASSSAADTYIYIDFSPALSGAFKLWTGMASGTRTATVTHSGGSSEIELSAGENSLGTFTSVTRIAVNRGAASTHSFRAISVDGVILINGVKGNSWTPTNFGGSNTIEKATGALPILNTLGGTIARPGVFGSEVGKTYTVTAAGGKFYLDGSVNPALTSLVKGATYKFDTSDSSNNTHPFIFGTTAEGANYTDGVARSHNDGTTWGSSFVSSSGNFGVGDANTCFDGDITTRNGIDNTSGNGTLTLTVDFKNVHKVEVLTGLQNTVSINDGSVIGTASADPAWVTYEPGTAFNLTTITIACAQAGTGGYRVDCYGIKVDNVLLVNNLNDRYTKITVPHNVPNTFYYHCGVHSAMGNSISGSILDETKADPYAWKNTLALPLVGSANDVSNQINIGSTAKAVTVTNATASRAQSNFYGGSYNFTSSSTSTSEQYLDVSPFITATSSWTLEFWIYRTQDTNNFGYIFNDDTAGALSCGENTSGQLNVGRDWFTAQTTYTPAIPLNTWTHFACSVSDGVATQYLNGVAVTTNSNMGITRTPTVDMRIGGEPRRDFSSNGRQFFGYLQDIRFYNGVAKYTSNFIPASTNPDILPDTPSGVSGSSKLTKITDGAVSFDGNDYLEVAYNSDLNLSNSDFTIELWMYPERAFDANDNGIISFGENTGSSKEFIFAGHTGSSGTALRVMGSSDGSNANIFNYVDVGTATIGAWQHIAIVRNGSSFKVYKNGIQTYSTDISTTSFYAQTTRGVVLGEYFNSGSPTGNGFHGFLSNVRVLKGTALYTSDFTPPTRALTNVTNTKLLCCQSPSDNATAVGTMYKSTTLYTTKADIIANATVVANGGSLGGSDYFYFVPNGNEPIGGTIFSANGSVTNSDGLNRWYWYWYNGSDWTVTNGSYNNTDWTTYTFGSDSSAFKLLPSRDFYVLGGFNQSAPSVQGGTAPSLSTQNLLNATVSPSIIIRNGDAKATNFNPFTTDINAVREQESGYATLNPLATFNNANPGVTNILTNGNLTFSYARNSGGETDVFGSLNIPSTGKWYWEVSIDASSPTPPAASVGIAREDYKNRGYSGAVQRSIYLYNGNKDTNGTNSAYGSGFAVGDLIGVTCDMDTNTISFYKNGVSFGSAFTDLSGSTWVPSIYGAGQNTGTYSINFGQKPFKFPPPEGFQPLNASTVRPSTVIARPNQYVGIATYNGLGTGSANAQNITFPFQPDLFWFKMRSASGSHMIWDRVRGVNENDLRTNSTDIGYNAPYTTVTEVTNGLRIQQDSPGNELNSSGNTYVAWAWKAGGGLFSGGEFWKDDVQYVSAAAAGLDGGSVNPTSASVGTEQGFSIIKWNPTPSTVHTVSHGLGKIPKFMILKQANASSAWSIYHEAIGATNRLTFTPGIPTSDTVFGDTAPTDTVFTNRLTTGSNIEGIAYLWADVPGLQKFGSYIGNASADGVFVELGFRPAVVLMKKTTGTGSNWFIHDSGRNRYNAMTSILFPNFTDQEDNTYTYIDFLSNGFKLRFQNADYNAAETYIFAAWAEAPTFNLYGAQSNAR